MNNASAATLSTLRHEVREFVREQHSQGAFTPTVDCWQIWNEDFTRSLAARGWVGMTIPAEHGGAGRSFMERFVVTEELLAAGAPVAAHWIADRQIAPSLLRYGSDAQKAKFLPGIARGEIYFAIGMSEPDSGSDLASVQSRAAKVDGGWKLNGSKIWTSGAHHAHAFFALVRTSPLDTSDRHAGLTQLIVDLKAPGVTVKPIVSLDGTHHFNEVFFEDVFIADEDVLGTVGEGWTQVTSELKFERSGPERLLSTFPALSCLVDAIPATTPQPDDRLGHFIARIAALRHLSFNVAGRLERGESAEIYASMVKVVGNRTEGDIAAFADDMLHDKGISKDADLVRLVELSLLRRPGFTLRGGTTEILRGIIARGVGPSGDLVDTRTDADFRSMVTTICDREFGPNGRRVAEPGFDSDFWSQLEETGLALLTTSEERGGSGASWDEAATLHYWLGYYGVDVPVVEHDILAGWLTERAGLAPVAELTTLTVLDDASAISDTMVVPFGADAARLLLVARGEDGWSVRDIARDAIEVVDSRQQIDKTRVVVRTDAAPAVPLDDETVQELLARGALARSLQMAGALARSVDHAVDHAKVREQFGRPLMKFQAVQAMVADAAAESALVSAAAGSAVAAWSDSGEFNADVERAVAVAKSCASHAVEVVTRNAHQVLGAMGTTLEHELHRVTVPLLSRKHEFGSAREWNRTLAERSQSADSSLWEWLTAG